MLMKRDIAELGRYEWLTKIEIKNMLKFTSEYSVRYSSIL